MSQQNNFAVRFIIIGFVLLALIGCGSSPQSTSKSTATPFPSVPLQPTVAPFPTVPSLPTVAPQRTATSAPNANPTATTASGLGAILFQDDFSDPKSGWFDTKIDCCQFHYKDGGYTVQTDQSNLTVFGLLPNHKFDDVSIEVDVTPVGPATAVFGVVCRASSSYDAGYFIGIRADGAHGIVKLSGTDRKELAGAAKSDAILPGTATNHLRAECNQNHFSLAVNGKKLLDASDGDYSSGQLGMMLLSDTSNTGVEIRFDNFVVRAATP